MTLPEPISRTAAQRHDGRAEYSLDLEVPARAMAISAHPDDSELKAGATLAKWAEAGCDIHIVVLTDGSKGTWDPTVDPAELVTTRQAEQQEAARRLGATSGATMCEWVDGELESGVTQRSTVARLIREYKPNVILGHDPWKRYRIHPDHRHAGLLTVEAIVAARDPHFFPEHDLGWHRPDHLLLFEADEPDHVESVQHHHVERQLDALAAHQSQYESTMFIPADDDGTGSAAFADRIRATAVEAGQLANHPLGEAFKRITDQL